MKNKKKIIERFETVELALLVKSRRNSKELTQHELAEIAGISRATIAMLECGRKGMKFTSAVRVMRALKVSGKEFEGVFLK